MEVAGLKPVAAGLGIRAPHQHTASMPLANMLANAN